MMVDPQMAAAEQQLPRTSIVMHYSFSPVQYILCDLGGIMGNFCEELLGAFYPRIVSKRANVLVTELVTNVLQNTSDPSSPLEITLEVNTEQLFIRMRNAVSREQFEVVRAHVDVIHATPDLRALMKKIIRERRDRRETGGIGLIRIVAENKFKIAVDYQDGFLIMDSILDVGGLL